MVGGGGQTLILNVAISPAERSMFFSLQLRDRLSDSIRSASLSTCNFATTYRQLAFCVFCLFTTRLLRVLSTILILSKNSRVLDAESRLRSAKLG